MFPRPVSIPERIPTSSVEGELYLRNSRAGTAPGLLSALWIGIKRRWAREQRRRKVGRAYDMALEVARLIPPQSRVLDVGCGNGFIAHHLSALLGTSVTGIDLMPNAEAPINYQRFIGTAFPVDSQSFDAVLLCYVLHHAQDLSAVLSEVRRSLLPGGLLVVYEDVPRRWWDRIVCAIHNRQWRACSGPCRFQLAEDWCKTFAVAGFEVSSARSLSRWRNLAHPVSRQLFALKLNDG
ncbi:MAG: methyltransferase domain-containing protein [Acidobacteriota bacterium]